VSLYDFESYNLNIYNRWGELIFNTQDRYLGWNGKHNDGSPQQEGVYVYLLTFKDGFGKDYQFKGSVTLLYGSKE